MLSDNARRKSKGYAIITTVLAACLLFPMVGLAIDVGILYVVRAQLWLAADAAAMAGARALGSATDTATQTANAQAAATAYFNANWPSHFWKSGTPTGPNVSVVAGSNIRSVVTTASVSVPLYFLRVLHQDAATVGVTATATRQDAFIELVLDRSSSMNYVIPSSGKTACSQMVAAAKSFVGDFTEGRDYIGLVVFSAGVFSYPPTTTFNTKDASGNTIPSLIGTIACGGNTATATGLHVGYKAMQDAYSAGLSAGRANIIVLMTDGRPNGVDGNFTPYAVTTACGANNLTGMIAQWAGGAVASGNTAGIMNHTDANDSGGDNTINAPNCNFNSGGSGTANATKMPQDINQIPNRDVYGNYTITNSGANYTSYTSQNPSAPWLNKEPVLAGANGSNHGPNGPFDIAAASINAADSQGITIRSDTTLKPQVYVIAVIGTDSTDIPDTLFLQKMANYGLDPNDATAKKFITAQSSQTKGYFVAAPDPTQIDAAFQQVAAQIGMRLAQ
jgi:Flp pilus assembly protein TadG